MPRFATFACILFFILSSGCNKTPDKIISINPADFSASDQIKVGGTFKLAIENNPGQFNLLSKSTYKQAYDYAGTLFQTVLNTAPVEHRTEYDWTLDIIHNDTIRTAFFLPGGHFYIYTGLLKFLDTESQLLGVIGHELYYGDTDIMIKRMGKAFGGTTLGDILLDNKVTNIQDLAANMPYLNFEEEKVLQADSFAVLLLCPFQYEPLGIKHIIDKASEDIRAMHWLERRFAPPGNRVQKIKNQAIGCGLPGVTNEAGYRRFKEDFLP